MVALAGNVSAASKKTPQKSKSATPPSKATRPTGYYDTLAHQKAITLVKQAADTYAKGDYNKAVWLCKTASDAYPTYARAQT